MALLAADIAFKKEPTEEHSASKIPPYIVYLLCVVIGVLASMLGIGGALLTIPLMTYTGIPLKKALGTGSAISMAVSLPGIITYIFLGYPHMAELPPFSIGYINMLAVAAIIPTSIILAPLGVKASHSLPKHALQRIFAVVLVLVAIRMYMTI